MKFINNIPVIIVCLILTGRNMGQIKVQQEPSFNDSILSCEINEKEEQSELFDDNLESWVGFYEFFEFLGTPNEYNQTRLYEINIYEESDVYYADIILDGFQVYFKAVALVQGDSESIDLILYSYFPDTINKWINEGELILTFEKTDDGIITKWGKIPPLITANEKPGIYFEYKESPNTPEIH